VPRIYLDNAATSHPKPESVYAAVDYYNRSLGAAAGRGGYRTAVEVDAVLRTCRKRAASLLGAESPERVAFAFNATDALNMALHGLLETGDHVVTTAAEHNSVLRPLGGLVDRRGIELSVVPVDAAGRVDPAAVRDALRHNTRLVVVQHASNVTGCVQPIEDIGSDTHQAGALVLVDAAQTAGHLAIDLADWPVDLLACAGHKGLLGPLGTGLLYVRPGLEDQLNGLRQGGTGSFSEQDRQPETMPDRLEAGNPNAPGLFGLEAGLEWLEERGVETIAAAEASLVERLLAGLEPLENISLVGPGPDSPRVGVVSLVSESLEPHELATVLDESFGIQARAGLHCAPGVHRAAGTFESGGTLRLSVGPFTTDTQIDAACEAIAAVTSG
jgi:cysteine desulfurase/selenocysteine lyase